jgi:hypothetical protein
MYLFLCFQLSQLKWCRFKRLGMGGSDNPPALRPSANSMMLKPKTPSSLPKSAMSKLEGPSSGSLGKVGVTLYITYSSVPNGEI